MRLPEPLCVLYNLQTLRVPNVCMLPPKGMSKLVNLRSLDADGVFISKIAGIGKLTCLQELKGPFKVSRKNNKGRRIGQLKGMNQLRGTLRIKNLERVNSVEEAAGIQLKDKVWLLRLELNWHGGSEYEFSSEGVIEALQPPRELKEMKLQNHPGSRPPSWMTHDPPLLSNLVTLELYGCRNYACLPAALGQLSCLKLLVIARMDGVKEVGPEFHCCAGSSDVVAFPSLEKLQFEDMYEWERWVGSGAAEFEDMYEWESGPAATEEAAAAAAAEEEKEEEEEETGDANGALGQQYREQRNNHKHPPQCNSFPCLRELHFKNCPKLATITALLEDHHLGALQRVLIWKCQESAPLIEDGEERENLPLHYSSMRMQTWSELEYLLLLISSSLDIGGLLIELSGEAEWCYSLLGKDSLQKAMLSRGLATKKRELLSWLLQPGRRLLKSLTDLEILDCDELTAFTDEEEEGWSRNLPSLQTLTFERCPNLQSLPIKFHSLSSVQKLCIEFCPQILALPEQGLPPTLQEMHIWQCLNLHSLPLPPSLQRLKLWGCPLLEDVMWFEIKYDLIGSSSMEYLYTDNRRLLSWLLLQPRRLCSLQELKIYNCKELEAFTEEEIEGWHRNLPSVQSLRIQDCPNLRSLPVSPSLRRLHIQECPLLEEATWLEMEPDSIVSSSLPSTSSSMTPVQLESLGTDNRRLLSWLLLQPRRLEFLEKLEIFGCERLATFTEEESEGWRRNLPSLKWLDVRDCPKLLSLPEGLHIDRNILRCPNLQAPPARSHRGG